MKGKYNDFKRASTKNETQLYNVVEKWGNLHGLA